MNGAASTSLAARRPGLGLRLARRAVLRSLQGLRAGRLEVHDTWGIHRVGDADDEPALRVRVEVDELEFYRRVLLGGSVGAARSYADGQWRADDLVALVRLVARERSLNRGLESGLARLSGLVERLAHRRRANSRRGSRRNIAAHYDLGNDFFSLFLDASMTYSAARFAHPGQDLEAAQRDKIDAVCRALELSPAHRVVEIGTGWGSFALHAASRYGCRVLTTTISEQQRRLALERVRAAGLENRVEVVGVDYRDLPRLGRRFDRLVSIEMIEAVGEAFLDRFLATCAELLAPDGAGLIQAILMEERFHPEYRRGADTIQRLVFPGSFLPSLGDLVRRLANVSDLAVQSVTDLTADYALTLDHWRRRFLARQGEATALGYDRRLLRLWDYYLAYCQGGFEERVIRDIQLMVARPAWRPAARPVERR